MSYGYGILGKPPGMRGDIVHEGPNVPIPSDETEAIRRCQKGDADAFSLIVNRYESLLFGTAYLMLRDRGQAEDAVQDAFVAAWRAIGSFRLDGSLRPWLLRILVNQALQKKRRKLLKIVPIPDFGSSLVSTSAEPELVAERAWERDEVNLALKALPENDSRILVLRYFAELSLAELSEALVIPEGTVKSRLHRAIEKLRKELLRREMHPDAKNAHAKEADQ